jgi:dipeptidyl aminopeptidase/acylaminoacyl peptidase
MTPATRPPRRRATRDPYGLLPKGTPVAMILSALGLVLVVVATMSLASGSLPFNVGGAGGGGGPAASGQPQVVKTPTPQDVVVVPSPEAPGITVPGTIVYAKEGNIWVQSDGVARQLTTDGHDSMASFSEDGAAVYFVRTRRVDGMWPVPYPNGRPTAYQMDVPAIMRVGLDGGEATQVLDGKVDPPGRYRWMGFIQGPVVSPDGRTIAMTSDLPDPNRSDVTLKLVNLSSKKISDPKLSQQAPLGHQDPAWRPDGQAIAYVRNERDGAKGAPRIYLYSTSSRKAKPVTGPGYLHPSWSPDGKYLAATKTSAYGTDVVILDAATGAELTRLTDDGESWGPSWSPAGNQVAFLHVAGQVIDLRMIQLDGSAPAWKLSEPIDLTSAAGLDGLSKPDWFVPTDQLPAPATPTVAPSPSP